MGDVIPFNHACCSELSTPVQMIKYLFSDRLLLLGIHLRSLSAALRGVEAEVQSGQGV